MLFGGFYIKHFAVYPDLFSGLHPVNFVIRQCDALQDLLFHPLFHPVTDGLLLHTEENDKDQGSKPEQDKSKTCYLFGCSSQVEKINCEDKAIFS